MGPWMDGCVPDSSRYVPARGAVHVSAVVAPAPTSVENDCTRFPCAGGVFVGPVGPTAMGHVVSWVPWGGLATVVAVVPRPPPN